MCANCNINANFLLEFSTENAEIMENCPGKMTISYLTMADYFESWYLAAIAGVAVGAHVEHAGRPAAATRAVPARRIIARDTADLKPAGLSTIVAVPRNRLAVAHGDSGGARKSTTGAAVRRPVDRHVVVTSALSLKGGGPDEASPGDGDRAVLARAVVVGIVRRAEARATSGDGARAGAHGEGRQGLRGERERSVEMR